MASGAGPWLLDRLSVEDSSSAGSNGGAGGGNGGVGGSGGAGGGGDGGSNGAGGGGAGGATSGGTAGGAAGAAGNAGGGSAGTAGRDVTFRIVTPNGIVPSDIAVGAINSVHINDGVSLVLANGSGHSSASSAGNPGSSYVGVRAWLQNLSSIGDVDLRNDSQLFGNLRTSGTTSLQPGATILGTRTEQATLVPRNVISWKVSFPLPSSGPISLEPNVTRVLDPGNYGQLAVKTGARLKLRRGTYRFEDVSVEPNAYLDIDNTAGPVFIYSRTGLGFGGITNPQAATDNVLFGVGALYNQIGSPWKGMLVANGTISLISAQGVGHEGSLFADDITLHQWTPFRHHAFIPANFCDAQNPTECGPFCPCDVGGACDSSLECASGLSCIVGSCQNCANGGCDGDMCSPTTTCVAGLVCAGGNCHPSCDANPSAPGCVAAHCANGVKDLTESNVDCGGDCPACATPTTCTTNADCTGGQVCGVDNGAAFGLAATADVCWLPACAPLPPADLCGNALSPCGTCPVDRCINGIQDAGEAGIDCGGPCHMCPVGDRQGGCQQDSDCPPGDACFLGEGLRLNFSASTNVCLPRQCLNPNPTVAICGAISATCGICPPVPSGLCAGRECGMDPTNTVQCGPLSVPCIQGKLVGAFSALSISLNAAARPAIPLQDIPALDPQEVAQEDSPGALEGSFTVDDHGGAAYSIPIVGPPGRAGIEPDIELRYNSKGANGIAGVGWAIGGLSSIARCPKTSATDGWATPVRYDATDALCLDGQRLIPVPGTNATEFRTEIDNFQKIVLVDPTQSPDLQPFFRVFRRDGRIYEYGGERNQRLYRHSVVGVVPRAWALSKIKDRAGNFMRFEYGNAQDSAQDTVEFFPASIAYGGLESDRGNVPASRVVTFEYFDSRLDNLEGFTPGGARTVRSKLLSVVRTKVLDKEVRSYELYYEYAPTGISAVGPQGPARVKAVKECSNKNGVRVCKGPTTFNYSDERGFWPNTTKVSGFALTGPQLIKLDFNGDGLDDFLAGNEVAFAGNVWSILFGSSNRGQPIQGQLQMLVSTRSSAQEVVRDHYGTDTTACFSQGSIADLNGDGKDDIFDTCWRRQGNGERYLHKYRVYTASSSGGVTSYDVPVNSPPCNDLHTPITFLIDVDGDGHRDIYEKTNRNDTGTGPLDDNGNSHYYRGHADGTFDPDPAGIITPSAQWHIQHYSLHSSTPDLTFVADVAGDGSPTVLTYRYPPAGTAGSLVDTSGWARYVVRADGSAKWQPVNGQGFGMGDKSFGAGAFKLIDVNGDGLKDWLWLDDQPRLAINTGGFFAPASQALSTTDPNLIRRFTQYSLRHSLAVDYDGNGIEDLLSLLKPQPGDPAGSSAHWLWDPANTSVSSSHSLSLDPAPLALGDPTRYFLQIQPGITPQSSLAGTLTGTPNPIFTMGDADGDGSQDLVQVADDGKLGITYGKFGRENLLTKIVDGTGKRVDVRYDDSSYFANGPTERTYQPATVCSAHTQCLKQMGPLVSLYTVSAQSDASNVPNYRYHYRYKDARRGLGGRGWLGFGTVTIQHTTATFPTEDLILLTEVNRDNSTFVANGNLFPYAGLEVSRVEVTPQAQSRFEKSPGKRAVITTRTWETGTSSRGGPFAFVRNKTTIAYDLAGSAADSKRHFYQVQAIDDLGNVLHSSVDTTSNGSSVASTITTAEFDTSDQRRQSWLISLLKKRSVEQSTFAPDSTFEQSRTTSWDYDELGLLKTTTREPDAAGDLSVRLTTTFNRDGNPFRNVRSVTVAGSWSDGANTVNGSRVAAFQYDDRGIFPRRVIRHVGASCPALPSLTDEANTGFGSSCLLDELRFDPRDGTLLGKVSPNGVAVQAAFDAFGRNVLQVSPSATISTLYEDAEPFTSANLRTIAAKTQVVTFNQTTGALSRRVFDPLGRLVQTEESGLDGHEVFQEFNYRWGNLVDWESRPHVDGDNSQGTIYNRYDSRWRLKERDYPDQTHQEFFTTTASNALATIGLEPGETTISGVIDANGNATYRFGDFRGQVARSLDASLHSTHYSYAAFGELAGIVDYAGNETEIDTDVIGRVVAHSDADTGLQNYKHTAFDEVFVHTDGVGLGAQRERKRVYSYDDAGRVSTIQMPEGGQTTFSYDTGPNALGRMVAMTSPTGQTEGYTFESPPGSGDARVNRAFQTKTTRVLDGATYETNLHYDNQNQLDRVTYPASFDGAPFEVHYRYDGSGFLQSAKRSVSGVDQEPIWERGNAYQGFALANETFGNNVSSSYTYDDDSGRLTSLNTQTGSGQLLQKIEYLQYDFNGNLTQRKSTLSNPQSSDLDVTDDTFSYDELNRLIPLDTAGNPQIAYDGAGNITSKEGVGTYNYSEAGKPYRPHAVQNVTRGSSTVVDVDYDDYGNLNHRSGEGVPGGSQDIKYSSFDLPIWVKVGTNTPITYDYDAAQQRVLSTSGNCGANPDNTCVKRTYVGRELERETGTDASGAYTRNVFKVFAGAREIAQFTNEARGPQNTLSRRYLHQDSTGSAQIVTAGDGTLAGVRRFSPFGDLVSTGPDSITKVRTGFTGHETDIETGLVNMRGRTYDPKLGRFLQADIPFAESPYWSQGLNRYSYVFNNPLGFTDPSGFVGEPEYPITIVGSAPDSSPASDPADEADPEQAAADALWEQIDGEQWKGLNGEAAQSDSPPSGGGDRFNPYDTGIAPYTSIFGEPRPRGLDYTHPPDVTPRGIFSALEQGVVADANAPGPGDNVISRPSNLEFAIAVGTMVVPEGKGLLAAEARIDTAAVRFSQDSVAATFRNGTSLNEAAAALRAGGKEAAAAYPPVRLFERNGALFTLDNRRLLVFSEAGAQVPFRMATEAEIAKEFTSKFTTTSAQGWGRFITVRPE